VQPEKSRHITLMIMPETSHGEVRRLRFERKWLNLALATATVLVLVTIAGVIFGISSLRRAERHESVVAENRVLRREMLDFDERLAQAHEVVRRLDDYEQKLRALTMVSDPARNLAMGPVGPAVREAQRDTVQSAQLRKALLSASAVEETIELMSARVENLEVQSEEVESRVESLSAFLDGQKARLSSTPSRRPSPGYVSSTFGMRVDPFTGLPQLHAGIDFAANIGAPVAATADGTVVVAGPFGAFGNTVQIDHGHGLTTVFAHMARVDVRVGDEVRRGDRIGAVGNTGRSTGPHLHYEVRLNGIPQDPSRFILD
jgi:murein DD-endopeptidase MepM/ murein hydrolase activator NlpD